MLSVYENALATLETQTQTLKTRFSEDMACRKGCSGCCIDGFKIRYIEALYLLRGFSEVSPETASQILSNLENKNAMQCPLLIDGACSVYNHRPVLCRAFGLIVQLKDKMATCELNFQNPSPERPLQSIDIQPYYELLDELSQRLWQERFPQASNSLENSAPFLSIREFLNLFLEKFIDQAA